ncbi:MAG: hypothetical protein ACYC4K_07600 [Thiobacillus sp.]
MKIPAWTVCLFCWPITAAALALPAPSAPTLPGRLFYSVAQRTMLNEARVRQVTELPKMSGSVSDVAQAPPAPVSFDGVITRSDGTATHWINGRPHVGSSSNNIRNLKPGQTRAAQKVYEPYQIRQPEPVQIPASPSPVKSKPEDTTP